MEYFAIEIRDSIFIMNDRDEFGGLIDNDVPHKVLGVVCDDNKFGDRCNVDCEYFRMGTCKAKPIRDAFGQLWHVLSSDDER